MNTYKPPVKRAIPLAATRPALPRNDKSDVTRHGAGLVMSRDRGEQLLMLCPDGSITVITAIRGTDGRFKIGIRCGRDYDVKRRETAPRAWIDRVEQDAV